MKYNIENRIKDTAIVNLTDFENAIDLYEDGEIEKALELMFGITVLGLGGDFETDDREIRRLLRNREYTVAKSNKTYCNKVYSKEVGQRVKLQLDDIAEMMANGATQQIIADSLSVSLDTIKYRVRIMKENFPSLYAESVAKAQTQGVKKCNKVGVSGSNDNDNDNVNVNVNDNVNGNGNVLPNQENEEEEMKGKLVPFKTQIETKTDYSYLEKEILNDGYIVKEDDWIDNIVGGFYAMTQPYQIETLKKKFGYTEKEANYIIRNIL